MSKYKVTVITICFNEEKTIRKTLESVLNQTYSDFEYIIKDGNSTDRSNEIIDSYKDQFEKRGIRFVHLVGNDEGIYDAMNIALNESDGEWVNFMNAGDSFYDQYVLEDVFQNKNWDDYGILYGHTLIELAKGYKFVQINHHERLINGVGISQQVCFVRKKLLEDYPFSKKYKILADFEFLLNAQDRGVSFRKLNMVIANYNRRGVSSIEVEKVFDEFNEILRDYGLNSKDTIKKFILRIKKRFIIKFPLFSDFLFCKHVSQSM